MQLKAKIKNLAKEKDISAQLIMQNFMLERLLERISISEYRKNFILKGGFLIAAMVGLDSRATMDMDATIKEMSVNEQTIKEMIENICMIDLDDDVQFVFCNMSEIRESDKYAGFRLSLLANYPPMSIPLKLDITTGDIITPKEIEYKFKVLLEDRVISIMAYNIETVVAEKLETILSRGDQNTRPRDYYDIYILKKMLYNRINIMDLKTALLSTAERRGSIKLLREHMKIMEIVRKSIVMQKYWENYQKDFGYASDIKFVDICNIIEGIMSDLKL